MKTLVLLLTLSGCGVETIEVPECSLTCVSCHQDADAGPLGLACERTTVTVACIDGGEPPPSQLACPLSDGGVVP